MRSRAQPALFTLHVEALGAIGGPEDQRLAFARVERLVHQRAQPHQTRHGGIERSGGGVGAKAQPRGSGGVGGEHAALGGVDDPGRPAAARDRRFRAGYGWSGRCAR